MSNSSIWLIDRTLSGATSPDQSALECNSNEVVLRIPPKLQYYWSLTIRLFDVISVTLVDRGLTLLQRCSQCILQHQPTELENLLVFLFRFARTVFSLQTYFHLFFFSPLCVLGMQITTVSEKFDNILLRPSLQRVYHVIKAVQAVVGTCCDSLYCGRWCAETVYIASFHM